MKSLAKVLEQQVNESEASQSEVSEQRSRNHRYYSLQPLGNERRGRSHYVSPDVMDAVEGKKAIFSETFLSNRDAVTFSKCANAQESAAKTAYVNGAFKRNQHSRLFRDGWHDAFVAKRMVIQAEWYEDTKMQEVDLQGVPMPVLAQQLQSAGDQVKNVIWDGVESQVMDSVAGPVEVLTGTLQVETPDSYVKYTLIQPERYYRDPDTAYADDGQWQTIEEEVSRGQLIDRGYEYDQVMGLNQQYRFRGGDEMSARKRHDGSYAQSRGQQRVDEQQTVTCYKTFTWLMMSEDMVAGLDLDFAPRDGYALYEIHWAHGEVLRWQGTQTHAIREVEQSGIFEWSEMKISHAEHGTCTADVVAHTQKTTSTLKRLIIDNQQIANSSRMGVMTNGLKNPRDLLENNIGMPLFMKRPDALMPLPVPQLSPLAMETLVMMKRDSEERSGISGLAKGMNTDAVKYQNSDNMIDRLTTAGQRRVTTAARDFANTFLVPLAQYTVYLAMKYDQKTEVIEVGGEQVQVAPQTWQEYTLDMDVAVALTPEEGQTRAQQLLLMHNLLSQDESMGLVYGVQQKHAVLDQVFELMGFGDTSNFMLAPSNPQYQQMAAQQGQMQQMAAAEDKQKQDAMIGAQIGHINKQTEKLDVDNMLNLAQLDWKRTNETADNLRADDELEHKIAYDWEKLNLDQQSSGGPA